MGIFDVGSEQVGDGFSHIDHNREAGISAAGSKGLVGVANVCLNLLFGAVGVFQNSLGADAAHQRDLSAI